MNEQEKDAWLRERAGKLTASRLSEALATTRSGWGASRANLMAELIVERLTGVPQIKFQNDAMLWGLENESEARNAYQFYQDVTVDEVAFVSHPTIPMSGASPDGLIGKEGLVEIKCPLSATHIETLLRGTIPEKYATQMHWQMACTGARWCDFVSYDPRMPVGLRMFVKRLLRNDALLKELEAQAVEFLAELDAKLAALNALLAKQAA